MTPTYDSYLQIVKPTFLGYTYTSIKEYTEIGRKHDFFDSSWNDQQYLLEQTKYSPIKKIDEIPIEEEFAKVSLDEPEEEEVPIKEFAKMIIEEPKMKNDKPVIKGTKVLNPKTNRWVDIEGSIGKKIIKDYNMS